jgi:hypothetical protein
MNKENKQSRYSNEQSNKTFLEKHPGIRGGVATVALASAIVGGGAYVANGLSTEKSVNTGRVSEDDTSQYSTIDANTETLLMKVQESNDRKFTAASSEITDIPLSSLKVLGAYDINIEKGGGIVVDAIESYKRIHNLGEQDEIPPTITDSINVTARSYVERERATGGNGQVQPGEQLALTEVQEPDGDIWAVVSDPIQLDTN